MSTSISTSILSVRALRGETAGKRSPDLPSPRRTSYRRAVSASISSSISGSVSVCRLLSQDLSRCVDFYLSVSFYLGVPISISSSISASGTVTPVGIGLSVCLPVCFSLSVCLFHLSLSIYISSSLPTCPSIYLTVDRTFC